ncbi:MBL fold metallo-hydrolase [Paenibacillus sp. GCM10027626]|uniref:MBL fold metallo-hydrolase n=1 Tax=Paenibacillus sp. GCM10027626 TaxID=3273411 RepID=UPI00363953A2
MKLTQVRNATLKLEFGGTCFLIDPFFADVGTLPPFPNTPNSDRWNPMVPLPVSVDSLLNVDAVIVTHMHPDHFDESAVQAIPKEMPIFAQSEADASAMREKGFEHVGLLKKDMRIGDVVLHKTSGQHGKGEIGKQMGPVSGIVFHHPDEDTLYIAGDTIWCKDVEQAINTYQPDVIVVNGGAAQFLEGGLIIMGQADVLYVHEAAPSSTIVVSHMEAINHCLLTRAELRAFAVEKGLERTLLVPEDGETLIFLQDGLSPLEA